MTQTTRKIFISYRRTDNAEFVHRIRDWLIQKYGRANVLMDFDSIPPLVKFADFIVGMIQQSDVVIVVIGPDWLNQFQQRMAAGESDYVRIELEMAVKLNKFIAPLCIQGATMPKVADLPPELRAITDINAAFLASNRDFYAEIERFMGAIEDAFTHRNRNHSILQAAATVQPSDTLWQPRKPDWQAIKEFLDRFERVWMLFRPNKITSKVVTAFNTLIDDRMFDQVIQLSNKYTQDNNNEGYRSFGFFYRGLAHQLSGDFANAYADYAKMYAKTHEFAKRFNSVLTFNRALLAEAVNNYSHAIDCYRAYIAVNRGMLPDEGFIRQKIAELEPKVIPRSRVR